MLEEKPKIGMRVNIDDPQYGVHSTPPATGGPGTITEIDSSDDTFRVVPDNNTNENWWRDSDCVSLLDEDKE